MLLLSHDLSSIFFIHNNEYPQVKRASHQQYRLKIQRAAKKRKLSESSERTATSHKSAIQDKLSPHILGQHGAELLMDFLRPLAFGPRKDSNPDTLFTMPGIVVDGTKVQIFV